MDKEFKAAARLLRMALKAPKRMGTFINITSGNRMTGDQFKPYDEQTCELTFEVSFTISKKETDTYLNALTEKM